MYGVGNCCIQDEGRGREVLFVPFNLQILVRTLLECMCCCHAYTFYSVSTHLWNFGGVRVRFGIREQRKIKGSTKPSMANLDITLKITFQFGQNGTCANFVRTSRTVVYPPP